MTQHALGNGRFLLLGQGPNLTGIFSGSEASPSVAGLICEDAERYSSSRTPGSNSWGHTVYQGENEMTFWDVLDPEYNVFRRVVRSHYYTSLRLEPSPGASLVNYTKLPFGDSLRGCACVLLPPAYRLCILCGGCASFDSEQSRVLVSPGEGMITLAFSASPDEDERTRSAVGQNLDVFSRDRAFWKQYLSAHPDLCEADAVSSLVSDPSGFLAALRPQSL